MRKVRHRPSILGLQMSYYCNQIEIKIDLHCHLHPYSQATSYLLPLQFPVSGPMQYVVFLCPASFIYHSVFEGFPCCIMDQYFLFYC